MDKEKYMEKTKYVYPVTEMCYNYTDTWINQIKIASLDCVQSQLVFQQPKDYK